MNDKIAQLLEQLAAKLGTTVQYLWAVLVKQAHYQVVINSITLVGIIAIISTYLFFVRNYYKEDGDHEYDDVPPFWVFVGGIVSLGGLVGCFILIDSIITCAYNPEYWALHEILHQLK